MIRANILLLAIDIPLALAQSRAEEAFEAGAGDVIIALVMHDLLIVCKEQEPDASKL